jgi:hypothetical protein
MSEPTPEEVAAELHQWAHDPATPPHEWAAVRIPTFLAIEREAVSAAQLEIERLAYANARLLTALRVADHRDEHDTNGPEEPMSGWPTCSVCGAILDPERDWRVPRAACAALSAPTPTTTI